MTQESGQKKSGLSRLTAVGIFVVVTAIFVGPRVLAPPLDRQAEAVKAVIGEESFTNFFRAAKPLGYAGYCAKNGGENQELIAAVEDYAVRNAAKMDEYVDALQEKALSARERDVLDRYGYKLLMRDVKAGAVDCGRLAARIQGGEWDL